MHAERRDRIRPLIAAHGLDGLLVTSLPNIRYLCGFSGSNAVLYVSGSDAFDDVIATDGRYAVQVSEESGDLPVLLDRSTVPALAAALVTHGIAAVLVEDSITLQVHCEVRAAMREVRVEAGIVERTRILKDPGELELLGRACSITAASLTLLLDEIRVGWTEIQCARRLEQIFGELGADDRAFETIVGSGPNSAIPHHQPTARPLGVGDLVVVDAGAKCAGYHADMTRTVVVGREPEPWQSQIHQHVLTAQQAGIDAAKAGADVAGIDAAARCVIEAAGFGAFFAHGLGHGVGLEIHEAPMVGARSVGRIDIGTPITIEPGIYLPGQGGVRIEDTIVVESGGSRVLTVARRDLQVVG